MALPGLDPIAIDEVIAPPNIAELTTKDLSGTGVFDVLMQTVKLHLGEEYNSGRINGTQYSDVYLGALGAVLQQSVSFLLNHQSEKKIAAEIGLIRQQTVTELANTDDSIPEGLAFNATTDVLGVIQGKKAIDAQQADLVTSQIATDEAQKELLGQKIITELAQTDADITAAKNAGHGYNSTNAIISGIIAKTFNKLDQETDLIEQKLVTELGQTSSAKPATLGMDPSTNITGLIKSKLDLDTKQATLVDSEIAAKDLEGDLLGQKIITELSQTGSDLTNALAAGHGYNVDPAVKGILESTLLRNATETSLIEQKIVTELGQTSLTKPNDLGQNTGTEIDGLIKSKIDIANKEAELVDNKIATSAAESALVGQKIITELAQTDDHLDDANAAGYGYNNSNIVEGVIKSTLARQQLEGDLIEQKIVTELGQTSDTKPAALGQTADTVFTGMVKAQKNKTNKESIYLAQKAITELAQTSDSVVTDTEALNNSTSVTGVISKQKSLYSAQTDGFARDAEQKLAKIAIDAWSLERSVNEAATIADAGLTSTTITSIINKAKTGINA